MIHNIHIHEFSKNNKSLSLSDVITKMSCGVSDNEIVTIKIETDKDLLIHCPGSIHTLVYHGLSIKITPCLFDIDFKPGNSTVEDYYKHNDFFNIELVVDWNTIPKKSYLNKSIRVEDGYVVSFVPESMLLECDSLSDCNIISYDL
jgi:hypothetical protein